MDAALYLTHSGQQRIWSFIKILMHEGIAIWFCNSLVYGMSRFVNAVFCKMNVLRAYCFMELPKLFFFKEKQ